MVTPATQRDSLVSGDPVPANVKNSGSAGLSDNAVALHRADNAPNIDPKIQAQVNKLLDIVRSSIKAGDYETGIEAINRIGRALQGDPTLAQADPLKINPKPAPVSSGELSTRKRMLTDRAMEIAAQAADKGYLDLALQSLESAERVAIKGGEFAFTPKEIKEMAPDALRKAVIQKALLILDSSSVTYQDMANAFEVITELNPESPAMTLTLRALKDIAAIEQERVAANEELNRRNSAQRDHANRSSQLPKEIKALVTQLATLDAQAVAKNKEVEGFIAARDAAKGLVETINNEITKGTAERDLLEQLAATRTEQAEKAKTEKAKAEETLAAEKKKLEGLTGDEQKKQQEVVAKIEGEIAGYDATIASAAKVVKALQTKNAELESLEVKLLKAQKAFVSANSSCEAAQQQLDEIGERHEELSKLRVQKEQELAASTECNNQLIQAYREQKAVIAEIGKRYEAAQREAQRRLKEIRPSLKPE